MWFFGGWLADFSKGMLLLGVSLQVLLRESHSMNRLIWDIGLRA